MHLSVCTGGYLRSGRNIQVPPPEYARITLLCLMLCSVPSKILYSIRTETQNFFSRMQKDRNRGMKYSRGCRGAGGVGVLEVASQSMTFVAGGVLEASGF